MRSPGATPRAKAADPSGRRANPAPPGTSFSIVHSSAKGVLGFRRVMTERDAIAIRIPRVRAVGAAAFHGVSAGREHLLETTPLLDADSKRQEKESAAHAFDALARGDAPFDHQQRPAEI